MKKLLLPFFCMSCVSAISAQNIPEDADTLSIGLKEVKVMASYGHDKGVEPVVLSTISAKDIATKLSNQEFPEIMKSTPSIYATKQGGGFGDSRLMLRGFGSENIAVLINVIPVNGMENGSVYWSNWSGLADVTNSIQVQRGIGLSKLGLFFGRRDGQYRHPEHRSQPAGVPCITASETTVTRKWASTSLRVCFRKGGPSRSWEPARRATDT